MKPVIAICLLAVALSACAATSPATPEPGSPAASAAPGTGGTPEGTGPTAGLTRSEDLPPEVAAWNGKSFYPTEFCWKVHTWSRDMPGYWDIRTWCDRRDRNNDNLWEPF